MSRSKKPEVLGALLTTQEVSEWLQVPVTTLREWRSRRSATGPPFVTISSRQVRYRRSAVQEWLEAQETRPTTLPRTAAARRRSRDATIHLEAPLPRRRVAQ